MILLACILLLLSRHYTHCLNKTLCVTSTDIKISNISNVGVNCREWNLFESAILTIQNDTTLAIYGEQIQVKAKVLVSYRDNIHLKGMGEVNTKLVCTGINTGFTFNFVSNLRISNIDFLECSLNFINQTVSERNFVIVAALFIVNSTNVSITKVKISKSLGIGMFFSQTHGNVTVYDSIFEHNGCSANQVTLNHEVKGGGIYIEIKHSVRISTQYILCNCELSHNNSTDSVEFKSDNNRYWGAKSYDFTQGGGITIFLEENRVKSDVLIENCRIYHNQADWGGGMTVIILNDFNDHNEK